MILKISQRSCCSVRHGLNPKGGNLRPRFSSFWGFFLGPFCGSVFGSVPVSLIEKGPHNRCPTVKPEKNQFVGVETWTCCWTENAHVFR